MANQFSQEYVLGIDLGSNSLGWAIIGLIDGEPAQLVRAGARVFEAGMEGDLESGQEQSRNLKRRQMRLQRRQTWRRARRLRKVFNLLQQSDLLPRGDVSTPDKRQDLINELDKAIRLSDWFAAKAASGRFPASDQTLPYILRAAALDEPLKPPFLGRALYHLAQRRGFLSARLKPANDGDEDEGRVKGTINSLRAEMTQRNSRTLGEFFSQVPPSTKRIRGSEAWTARDMYETEFDLICKAQSPHHPEALNGQNLSKLREAIFHQRPLKFDPNVIGKCDLEPEERHAPAYLLLAQRFRLLQTVNNLRLLPPGDTEKTLTPADRAKLLEALEINRELSFPKIRKLLGLTKEYVFKSESEGEKRVIGNRTAASLHEALGERWLSLTSGEQSRLVDLLHSSSRSKDLIPVLKNEWGLGDNTAEQLSEVSLEPNYMNLSCKAMERLLPRLERGESFMEARKAEYPESFTAAPAVDLLPPLLTDEAQRRLGAMRNPAVMRCLSELRRVVNSVVRAYGKPTRVRIELARQIKKSKKQRQAISKRNQENQASRLRAIERIKEMNGDPFPSRDDIRRIQLFDECKQQCVYCGDPVAARNFLGRESQVDVDHIIPFSRSLDDSYMNLVICHSACNRLKGNCTPHEAFSGHAERYEQILGRVKRFCGDRRTQAEKLRRFSMNEDELKDFLDNFRTRQLNDTAYAARLATRYLGFLYGGIVDPTHDQRVFAPSGQTTSYFRSLWKLNSILNDGPSTNGGSVPKSREDHRHHAVDAVVIGLTDAGMIKRLSDAAQRAPLEHRRRLASLEAPWPDFVDSVRAEIDKIVVSHRISKKVSGVLHKETNYRAAEFGQNVRRHRVAVRDLSVNDIMSDTVIPELGVREAVRKKLAGLGGDPKRFPAPDDQASIEAFPCFINGVRRIPIKRVRIQETVKTRKIGEGPRTRYAKPGRNHHLEIFGLPGADGHDSKWEALGVVTMLDAYERLRKRKHIVEKHSEPGWEFRFSIAQGETLTFDAGPFKEKFLVVRTISEEEKTGSVKIEMAPINDARLKADIKRSKLWVTKSPNELRKWRTRKVLVSPLGEVREAHD